MVFEIARGDTTLSNSQISSISMSSVTSTSALLLGSSDNGLSTAILAAAVGGDKSREGSVVLELGVNNESPPLGSSCAGDATRGGDVSDMASEAGGDWTMVGSVDAVATDGSVEGGATTGSLAVATPGSSTVGGRGGGRGGR